MRALATRSAARGQHLVTHLETVHLLTHLDNFASKLVPNTEWLYTIAVTCFANIITVIHVQVRAANTAALDIQNDTVFGFQRRVRIRLKTNIARTVEYESFHVFILTLPTLPAHCIRVFLLCRANTARSDCQKPASRPKRRENQGSPFVLNTN